MDVNVVKKMIQEHVLELILNMEIFVSLMVLQLNVQFNLYVVQNMMMMIVCYKKYLVFRCFH